jgi:hypothetical protein
MKKGGGWRLEVGGRNRSLKPITYALFCFCCIINSLRKIVVAFLIQKRERGHDRNEGYFKGKAKKFLNISGDFCGSSVF